MMIDLNAPFSSADVARLLASKDDSKDRQLRVTVLGIAYLSDVVGYDKTGDIAFSLEIWCAGNSYTGPEAAADANFVRRIERALRSNWPKPSNTHIDIF